MNTKRKSPTNQKRKATPSVVLKGPSYSLVEATGPDGLPGLSIYATIPAYDSSRTKDHFLGMVDVALRVIRDKADSDEPYMRKGVNATYVPFGSIKTKRKAKVAKAKPRRGRPVVVKVKTKAK